MTFLVGADQMGDSAFAGAASSNYVAEGAKAGGKGSGSAFDGSGVGSGKGIGGLKEFFSDFF